MSELELDNRIEEIKQYTSLQLSHEYKEWLGVGPEIERNNQSSKFCVFVGAYGVATAQSTNQKLLNQRLFPSFVHDRMTWGRLPKHTTGGARP